MKKLLFLLTSFSLCSLLSVNETSCFCFRNKDKDRSVSSIIKAIDAKDNIYALGLNLEADSNNAITKKSILDNIGLSESEQDMVTLDSTLVEDSPTNTTFTVSDGTTTEETTNDVTWYKQSPDFKSIQTYDVTSSKGKTYVATGGNGVKKSTDGITFTDTDIPGSNDKNVFRTMQYGNYVYAGTNANGLWKSSDGTNFTQLGTSDLGSKDIYTMWKDSKNIYVGTLAAGLWKSDNSEATFTNSFFSGSKIHWIEGSPDGKIIYASEHDNGLWKSTDDGDSFEEVDPSTLSSLDVLDIFVTSDNAVYVGILGGGIYKSDDGTSFTKIPTSGLDSADVLSILQASNGDIYIGTDTGLWKSTDGTDFEQVTSTQQVSEIAQDNNVLYLSADYPGYGSSKNGLYYYAL